MSVDSFTDALADVREQREAESSMDTGPQILAQVMRDALRDWRLSGETRVVVHDCLATLCTISSRTTTERYRAVFLLLLRDIRCLARSPVDHVYARFRFCPSWIRAWLAHLDHLSVRAGDGGIP